MKYTVAILGLGHWYSAYPLAGAASVHPDLNLKWIVDVSE